MKAVLLTGALAFLIPITLFAETTQTPTDNPQEQNTQIPSIVLGPVGVTVKPEIKKEIQIDFGLEAHVNNFVYYTSTRRLLTDLGEVTSLSAGISWKF